jgi:hypothetical protein
MAEVAPGPRALASLLLPRSRAILRTPMGRALTVSVAFVYGFISLLVGNMLSFGPTFATGTVVQILEPGSSPQWWNFPALVVIAPGGTLILPFFATVTMVVVSIGVGIGMSVGIVLAVRLLRQRTKQLGGPTAVGSLAGLTPAMLALVTLGACCSTTAAATAGIGAVAQASGSSTTALLANSAWYLGVFQMVVLFVALLAQEQLLTVYGILFGLETTSISPAPVPRVDRRSVVGAIARIALLGAGVTWALAAVAEWATGPAGSVAAAVWFQALVEHEMLALLAIAAALFAVGTERAFHRLEGHVVGRALRGALLVGGLLLLVGTPPPLSGWGVHGLTNEIAAALGVPASAGAVPAGVGGLALLLRWLFQFGLLGGFAIAVALSPTRAFRALLGTTNIDRSERTPAGDVRVPTSRSTVIDTSVASPRPLEAGTAGAPPDAP